MSLVTRLAPLALALLAAAPLHVQAQKIDNQVVDVSSRDRAMAAAIAKAQATLDDFLRVAAKPPAGASDFKLKVRVRDAHGIEHLWVTPFKVLGKDRFEGIVANQPRDVEVVERGDTHRFTRAEVSDWGYVRDGKQIGSFTVCALFTQMPPEQVRRYKQDHGFVCAE
ncbi:MAG: DUF2314 domain-containing protein [Pseudomonadota bacterium]|nr:DUF2314 domain-containing protein [Pseudomonadota bacterium]